MKEGLVKKKASDMAMNTTRLTRRFVITSLLALLVPIVLFAPHAYAEPTCRAVRRDFPAEPEQRKVTQDGADSISRTSPKKFRDGKALTLLHKARWLGLETGVLHNPLIEQGSLTGPRGR
jgi:hypothetical protein